MQRVKNEHYVPQCCLRRHTRDGKTIFVFDKPKRKAFPRNIDEVASEAGFYDLAPEFAKDFQVVEKWLCKIEGEATSAIDHLIDDLDNIHGFNHKDHALRAMIAMFLAIQHSRTALARQTQTQRRELIAEELKARGIEVPAELLNVPDKRIRFEHCRLILDRRYIKKCAEVLFNHIWLIGQNETSQPLYISDAPITFYPHGEPANPFSGVGFMTKGVEIDFPLSPKYALMLCERSHFAQLHARFEGCITRLNEENVKFHNGLQVWSSRRQVFCIENKFDQVRAYEDKQPDFFDEHRPRVEIIGGVSKNRT
jgi:Protein of unknown function (DUF4238)